MGETIQIGDHVTGKVIKFNKLSADLDLDGLPMQGNIHVSDMNAKSGADIKDLLKMNETVTARIKMIPPVDFLQISVALDNPQFAKKPLSEFKEGDEVSGKVLRQTAKYVFLDVGCMKDAAILKSEGVNLKVGETVKVK